MKMPNKMALVEFEKCHPKKCDSGLCAAARACPRRLIWQEAAYEIPMVNPLLCHACGDCVRACSAKALKIVIQ